MVNLGLCPVEYIETNKIKNSDYAKNNLTLFCNNEQKLKKIFDKIKINSKTINKNLKINYNSLFKKKISIAKIISIIKNEKS